MSNFPFATSNETIQVRRSDVLLDHTPDPINVLRFSTALINRNAMALNLLIIQDATDYIASSAESLAANPDQLQMLMTVLSDTRFMQSMSLSLGTRADAPVKADIATLTMDMVHAEVTRRVRVDYPGVNTAAIIAITGLITVVLAHNGLIMATRPSMMGRATSSLIPDWSTIRREAMIAIVKRTLAALTIKPTITGSAVRLALVPLANSFANLHHLFNEVRRVSEGLEIVRHLIVARTFNWGHLLGDVSGEEQSASIGALMTNFTLVRAAVLHTSDRGELASRFVVDQARKVGLGQLSLVVQTSAQLITELEAFERVPLSKFIDATCLHVDTTLTGVLNSVTAQPTFGFSTLNGQASIVHQRDDIISMRPLEDVERHLGTVLTAVASAGRQLPISLAPLTSLRRLNLETGAFADDAADSDIALEVHLWNAPESYLEHMAAARSSGVHFTATIDEMARIAYSATRINPDPESLLPTAGGNFIMTSAPAVIVAFTTPVGTTPATSSWTVGSFLLPQAARGYWYLGSTTVTGDWSQLFGADVKNRLNQKEQYAIMKTGMTGEYSSLFTRINVDLSVYELLVGSVWPEQASVFPQVHVNPPLAAHAQSVIGAWLSYLIEPDAVGGALSPYVTGGVGIDATERQRALIGLVDYLAKIASTPTVRACVSRVRTTILTSLTDPASRAAMRTLLAATDLTAALSIMVTADILMRFHLISREMAVALRTLLTTEPSFAITMGSHLARSSNVDVLTGA